MNQKFMHNVKCKKDDSVVYYFVSISIGISVIT